LTLFQETPSTEIDRIVPLISLLEEEDTLDIEELNEDNDEKEEEVDKRNVDVESDEADERLDCEELSGILRSGAA
jgi:hypothetical protein